jgi:NAD(P)H dehydrogenase (quinone)
MSIVVTGATGHLGHLVVEHLLERGVAPDRIVAGGRQLEKAADLAERGVDVRRIDYDDPASMAAAFEGAERVLIVSGLDFGRRAEQHVAAAHIAKDAGAQLVAYTSIPHADTSSMKLAADHAASEAGIREVGVPFTFLRNDFYLEEYVGQVPTILQYGAVTGSAGDGRISSAARTELAEAAAVVLTTDGHENAVYELGGDTSFTQSELADVVAEVSGKPIVYNQVSIEELTAILADAGLPQPVAEIIADADRAIGEGALHVETGDLSRLLGRPTTTIREAVAAALR